MKRSSIIWGVILILIGLVALLRGFGLIYFSWWSLCKMWPFIFIIIGISVLPVKGGVKSILYIIALICCVGSMIYLEKDNPRSHANWKWEGIQWNMDRDRLNELKEELASSDQTTYFTFDDSVTTLHIDAELLSGKYTFKGKSKVNSLQFYFQGNEYSSSIKTKGTQGFVYVTPQNYKERSSSGTIRLDEKKSYVFDIKSEEADVRLDLSRVRTDTLRIDSGVKASWDITLSDLNSETYLSVQSHPDSDNNISITIPHKSGYQMTTDMITGEDHEGGTPDMDINVHRSENFDSASSKVFIFSDRDSPIHITHQ